jgi:hypothetical protein
MTLLGQPRNLFFQLHLLLFQLGDAKLVSGRATLLFFNQGLKGFMLAAQFLDVGSDRHSYPPVKRFPF